MRSDARKRLEETNGKRLLHHDPAVCDLIERERQKAAEQGWDEGATFAAPYDGGYLRSVLNANPHRSETGGEVA